MEIENIIVPAQHARFKAAPWYTTEKVKIIVGGAGGIGSWTAFLLGRAGFYPIVYDFDRVEEHNLGGQLFSRATINCPKVVALRNISQILGVGTIVPMNERVTKDTPTHQFVIAAFDNMEARRTMLEKWVEIYGNRPEYKGLFIDPRLSMENLWIYAIKSGDTERIKHHLKEKLPADALVPDEACSAKQTSHVACIIAGLIVSLFTNHYTNIKSEFDERNIPYETTMATSLMMYESKNEPVYEPTINDTPIPF